MRPISAAASLLTLLITFFIIAECSPPLWAAPSREQLAKVAELKSAVRRAGVFYKEGKYQESGEIVKQVQSELQKMAADGGDVLNLLESVHKSLKIAHSLLELEGIGLPPLKPLAEMAGPGDKPDDKPDPASGKVSFQEHVAPLLVGKCGRCHVDNARGMFSMANFASLMKGTPDGTVIFPKDAQGSRLIEVIESGDMPRGGLKITEQEVTVLRKWIDEGAEYDGGDVQLSLSELAPNVSTDLPKVEVMKSTGNETVSFASDLAPVLNEKCANCHGNGRRPSGRFDLTSFESLLKGGESGPPVLPGKPGESLLIAKLKGTASGQQMPRGMPPLPDEMIAKFETWIQEGATFDGPDPAQNIGDVAALARALASTHEELSADRAERAEAKWRLGMPGIDAQRVETENFLLLGNVGEATLADYGKVAEELAPQIAQLFKAEPVKAETGNPLIKGRMTLYLFTQRYDYSEFGKMAERRDLPKQWRGHWIFDIVDAYAAMIAPRGDEYSFKGLVVQQIAGAYIASLSHQRVPRWFSEGAARVAAVQLASDDPRVAQWKEEVSGVKGAMQKSDDFIEGKMPPEASDLASYSFVEFLMKKDRKRFDSLLDALRSGEAFLQAFSEIYGGSPSQMADVWARSRR